MPAADLSPRALPAEGVIYLEDTSAEQGALRVVPGFHRRLRSHYADSNPNPNFNPAPNPHPHPHPNSNPNPNPNPIPT